MPELDSCMAENLNFLQRSFHKTFQKIIKSFYFTPHHPYQKRRKKDFKPLQIRSTIQFVLKISFLRFINPLLLKYDKIFFLAKLVGRKFVEIWKIRTPNTLYGKKCIVVANSILISPPKVGTSNIKRISFAPQNASTSTNTLFSKVRP